MTALSALAQQAYEAYAEVTGWKNFRGEPMPQFRELPEQIRQAWIAAVRKVYTVVQEESV